jgi:hypothetical protein
MVCQRASPHLFESAVKHLQSEKEDGANSDCQKQEAN